MNKEEFKAKANQTIDEVSAKINELKAKQESVKDDVKTKYEDTIKDLELKKHFLEAKYLFCLRYNPTSVNSLLINFGGKSWQQNVTATKQK